MAGKSLSKTKVAKSASIKRIPVAIMVKSALADLNNKKGTSVQAVVKYISTNYDVNIKRTYLYIKKYLVNAVASQSIIQTKGIGATGSFKLPPKKKKTTKKNELPEVIDEMTDPTRKKKAVTEKTEKKTVTETTKNKKVNEKEKKKTVTETTKNKKVNEKETKETVTEKKEKKTVTEKTKNKKSPTTEETSKTNDKLKEKPGPSSKNTNKIVPPKKQAAKKNVSKSKK